jgi:pilus assembly protein Flp/PilA
LADSKHGRPAGAQAKEWLVRHLLDRFIDDQSGVTAIEYALIGVLIAVVIVVAVTAVGTSLSGTFTAISSAL